MFTNRPAITTRPQSNNEKPKQSTPVPEGSGASKTYIYHIRDRIQRKLLNETDGEVNLSHRP